MKKKIMSVMLAAMVTVVGMTGCGSKAETDTPTDSATVVEDTTEQTEETPVEETTNTTIIAGTDFFATFVQSFDDDWLYGNKNLYDTPKEEVESAVKTFLESGEEYQGYYFDKDSVDTILSSIMDLLYEEHTGEEYLKAIGMEDMLSNYTKEQLSAIQYGTTSNLKLTYIEKDGNKYITAMERTDEVVDGQSSASDTTETVTTTVTVAKALENNTFYQKNKSEYFGTEDRYASDDTGLVAEGDIKISFWKPEKLEKYANLVNSFTIENVESFSYITLDDGTYVIYSVSDLFDYMAPAYKYETTESYNAVDHTAETTVTHYHFNSDAEVTITYPDGMLQNINSDIIDTLLPNVDTSKIVAGTVSFN